MKITYAQVQNKNFTRALGKLATYGGFTDYKELANIKSFLKQFEKVAELAQTQWIDLIKQHCELDEKGEIKSISPQEPGTYKIKDENVVTFKNERDNFDRTAIEIKAKPIAWETVKGVGLSAADLLQLEDIIVAPADFVEETDKVA